ncbi:hypothetical protein PIB30_054085 [Stylosanthes scabra]|uniref:Uncharacterized protein n=1 Tax=Stylosanthes scabra TaxID=79078 RepID=A0ABU6YIV7_9FABA|nr:hypothetical protein [Stylosanthes scabra]
MSSCPLKGIGRPQVLLGRPFLKTAEFKLIYYDEIFTFSVGNVIEVFHLTLPPKPLKKRIQRLKVDNAEKKVRSNPKKNKKKKKKEPDEAGTKQKKMLKSLSFDGLLGKLKVLKDVVCHNKRKGQSLWTPDSSFSQARSNEGSLAANSHPEASTAPAIPASPTARRTARILVKYYCKKLAKKDSPSTAANNVPIEIDSDSEDEDPDAMNLFYS